MVEMDFLAWIPLKPNTKLPLVRWRKYQNQPPSFEEMESWYRRYGENINYGVLTGKINNLVVVDIDKVTPGSPILTRFYNKNGTTTTSVNTNKGKHFYYFYDYSTPLKTQVINLEGYTLEIKGEGSYVVAPPSTVNGFTRYFNPGLDSLQPLPNWLTSYLFFEKYLEPKPKPVYKYKGEASCIKQILDRDLKKGERGLSLFVLASLLVKNYNSKEVIISILQDKNKTLQEPIEDHRLRGIINSLGKYKDIGCIGVNRLLPYTVNCAGCLHKKGGIMLNKDLVDKLNVTERAVLFSYLLKYYKADEIAKDIGITRGRVYQILKKIEKEEGKQKPEP